MASILVGLLVLFALWICPFWRQQRHFLPLYFWAIYAGLGPAPVFGVSLLRFRWVLGCAFGAVGLFQYLKLGRQTLDSMVVGPALFIAWAGITVIYSDIPEYSLARAVALVPVYLGAFLGTRALLQESDGLENAIRCIMTFVGVGACVAAIYYFTGANRIEGFGGRFHGHLKATGTGNVLTSSLPFLILGCSMTVGRARLALAGLTVFATYLLLLTRSRAPMAGAAVVLPVAFAAILARMRTGQIALVTAACFLVGGILWIGLATDDTREFLRLDSETRGDRWEVIFERAMESPVVGHGLGTVRYITDGQMVTWSLESGRAGQMHSHNEYLSLFYDAGALPPMLLLCFVMAVGFAGLRMLGHAPSRARNMLVAVFLAWFMGAVDTLSHDGMMSIGRPDGSWFWIQSLAVYYGLKQLGRGLRDAGSQ